MFDFEGVSGAGDMVGFHGVWAVGRLQVQAVEAPGFLTDIASGALGFMYTSSSMPLGNCCLSFLQV